MILIILAAGKGTRLPIKFKSKPKCMVEIKKKTLLEHNSLFFKNFKKKFAVVGYKHNKLNYILKKMKIKKIINKNYNNTNMVYSLFCAKNKITEDVVICYGDIIFDHKIFNLLKPKKNILPINKNWLKTWKGRMSLKKVYLDAENIILKNSKIVEIGGKIKKNNLPKYQYMGLIKLVKKDYFNCYKFFKKQKKDIDFTTFLNLCVKNKIIKLNSSIYNSFWYEVDSRRDVYFAMNNL